MIYKEDFIVCETCQSPQVVYHLYDKNFKSHFYCVKHFPNNFTEPVIVNEIITCCLCNKPSSYRLFHDLKVHDYCEEHLPVSISELRLQLNNYKQSIERFLLEYHELKLETCIFCNNLEHADDCIISELLEVVK